MGNENNVQRLYKINEKNLPVFDEIFSGSNEPKYRQCRSASSSSDQRVHRKLMTALNKETLLKYCFPEYNNTEEKIAFEEVFKFDNYEVEDYINREYEFENSQNDFQVKKIVFENTIPLNETVFRPRYKKRINK